MTLHAWVDESMTTAVTPNTPEPFYILAAAVADPDDCDGTRSQLRDLLPRAHAGVTHLAGDPHPVS